MPGADGAAGRRRARERASGPSTSRPSGARLGSIEAVQALRGWRDRPASRPASGCRRGWRADGYDETAEHVARLARMSFAADGGGAGRLGAGARRRGRDPALRRLRPRGARAQARGRARAARGRDRALRAQARQRRLRRPRRRRTSSRPSATSSRACGPSWRRCERRRVDRVGDGRRALPALARAVRHALRPGPDAPADDRARSSRAAVRLDPRRRHQRQVLDRADDRRDPRRPRAAHRRLPVAAPGVVRRADPDRRRGSRAGGLRRRGRARRARRRARRSLARRGRPRDPVRGADRGGVLGARRARASRSR